MISIDGISEEYEIAYYKRADYNYYIELHVHDSATDSFIPVDGYDELRYPDYCNSTVTADAWQSGLGLACAMRKYRVHKLRQ